MGGGWALAEAEGREGGKLYLILPVESRLGRSQGGRSRGRLDLPGLH